MLRLPSTPYRRSWTMPVKQIFFILVLLSGWLQAKTDTLHIESRVLQKTNPAVVVVPDIPVPAAGFALTFILHGYSGSAFDWPGNTDLQSLADRFAMVLVCPDGGYDSWYLDSPKVPDSQYESHIIKELYPEIRRRYAVDGKRESHFITGLSMGGHGALFLAIRHPEIFGAAASMSGGVDLTYSTKDWEIAQKIGRFEEQPENWQKYSVTNMTEALRNADLPLLIDCGTEDFFLEINRKFHEKLLNAGIAHFYIEAPGGHTWEYWVRALPLHLQFFQQTRQENN